MSAVISLTHCTEINGGSQGTVSVPCLGLNGWMFLSVPIWFCDILTGVQKPISTVGGRGGGPHW